MRIPTVQLCLLTQLQHTEWKPPWIHVSESVWTCWEGSKCALSMCTKRTQHWLALFLNGTTFETIMTEDLPLINPQSKWQQVPRIQTWFMASSNRWRKCMCYWTTGGAVATQKWIDKQLPHRKGQKTIELDTYTFSGIEVLAWKEFENILDKYGSKLKWTPTPVWVASFREWDFNHYLREKYFRCIPNISMSWSGAAHLMNNRVIFSGNQQKEWPNNNKLCRVRRP